MMNEDGDANHQSGGNVGPGSDLTEPGPEPQHNTAPMRAAAAGAREGFLALARQRGYAVEDEATMCHALGLHFDRVIPNLAAMTDSMWREAADALRHFSLHL